MGLKRLDNAMCWSGQQRKQSTFPYAYTNKGGHVIVRGKKGTHAGHEGIERGERGWERNVLRYITVGGTAWVNTWLMHGQKQHGKKSKKTTVHRTSQTLRWAHGRTKRLVRTDSAGRGCQHDVPSLCSCSPSQLHGKAKQRLHLTRCANTHVILNSHRPAANQAPPESACDWPLHLFVSEAAT